MIQNFVKQCCHTHYESEKSEVKLIPKHGPVDYTCPMHPEVVREDPGSCPKCGMALEPKSGSSSPDDTETRDISKRFWVSLFLSAPIVLLALLEMMPNNLLERIMPMRVMNWIQLFFATPVVLWGGWRFFERGALSVIRKSLNMFTLIALGIGVATIYSVVATFFPVHNFSGQVK